MKQFMRSGLVLAALTVLVGFMQPTAVFAQDKAPQKDLVLKGDAKCTTCHDETEDYPVLGIGKTRHGGSAHLSGLTCASCHGESDAHLTKPQGKDRPPPDKVFGKRAKPATAEARSEACLNCHSTDRRLSFWESGRHKKNDVACDSCHVVHEPKNTPLRADNPSISPLATTMRQLEYETCNTCHKQIRSQLLKTSHHPIIEGKVKCSNCHNPHGALTHAMIKEESVNQLCTNCHADKRGPFMNEHPPVEENCLTCHNSHGSSHGKLLSERVPNVCQDCHDWSRHPGTYYSGNQGFGSTTSGAPNTRLVSRACLNCHNSIHGSNAPANRGKFFLR
jgi:DmsE family decaheme c-type cytochrome